MNRSERDRQSVLETELLKVAAAEERALIRLRKMGFRFTAISQARMYATKIREANRAQARHLDMVDRFASGGS